MARQWTPDQQKCLDATGTVLVSAAAGSGKTAVLIERITRLITDKDHPVDVDRLLVVTFTKAAAAEMKQRLTVALTKALAENPQNTRLRRQIMRLPDANICTVDSFCARVVRDYFHRLPQVSPQFRVLQGEREATLRREALDEVMEECYAQNTPAFQGLLTSMKCRKNDTPLRERILKLYGFIQAAPDPEEWLSSHETLFESGESPNTSLFGREIRQYLTRQVDYCLQLNETAGYLSAACEPLHAFFESEHHYLLEIRQAVVESPWDELYATLSTLSFPRRPSVKEADASLERAKELRTQYTDLLKKLSAAMVGTEPHIASVTAKACPQLKELLNITRRFSAGYAAAKTAQNYLDFSDLEHLALQLFTERDGDGVRRRTPLARELGERFSHILVDEYQDTNPTQEWLFSALSQEERNLFFVGDVKQSIYAFRNATPDLFLSRRNRYPAYDGQTYPAAITLDCNFRSRQSVTDTANFLFNQLMTEDLCGVAYDRGEALVPKASYDPRPNDSADLLLTRTADSDESVPVLEARAIAAKLRQYRETMTVTQDGVTRPMRWGDACILLRSVKDVAVQYADELNRLGIPALAENGKGFFETPEILCVLSLLRFLDNPLNDIALLAVLFSPLFGFSPDDLAALRQQAGRKCPLFAAIRRCVRSNHPLADRLSAFLSVTDRLRTAAIALPADRLLQQLYATLSIPAVMRARPHGEQRLANLQKLLDISQGFEQNGYRGLSAFVRYLDRQCRESDEPLAPVVSGEDAVRILSIHQSKGLEYPVVFLADLARKFNDRAQTEPPLLHRDLGVGLRYIDPATLETFDSLPYQAISHRMRRDDRAESMRVLYVAATRAREKLCLLITGDIDKLLAQAAAGVRNDPHIPAPALFNAASYAHWVLAALLRHPDAAPLRLSAQTDWLTPLPCDTRLTVSVQEPLPAIDPVAAESTVFTAAPDEWPELEKRLSYRYPYESLRNVPAKLAVSDLAHRRADDRFLATARPAFFSETDLTPAERGTALHQFLRYADFSQAAADLPAEVRRLQTGGFLTAQQAKSLPLKNLHAFFESPLYRRMVGASEVLREYAFSVERPAADCFPALRDTPGGAEPVLIQGIADCLFCENGRWVLVDYKTDRVRTESELVERYRTQLHLYADALRETLRQPIDEQYLYSFHLHRAIPLPPQK